MRTLAATMLLVSLISPIAISQTTALEKPAVVTPPPAWEWTLDERIAKRLDPTLIRERTQARERDRVEKDGFTPEVLAPVSRLRAHGRPECNRLLLLAAPRCRPRTARSRRRRRSR